MGENFHSDDVIYVAVNQDVGESESTLLWILNNLQFKKLVLLHVHALFSKTTSSCRFEQSEIDAVKESQVEDLNSSFDKYSDICTNNGVNEEDVGTSWISGYDVGEGIVKLIYQNNIKKLAMGAAADPHYSRKMSITSRKAKYVSEHAPLGCKMWFICKGKLITTKEGSVDLGNSPEFSPSERRGRDDNKTAPPKEHPARVQKKTKNINKVTGKSTSSGSEADSTPDPPHDFICPITLEIMRDPHVAADGFTYEAEAFKEYLIKGAQNSPKKDEKKKLNSPKTNEELENYNLTPNRTLRTMINDWLEKNPNYKD